MNLQSRKGIAQMSEFTLTLSCRDRPGLVAEVAGTFATLSGNIVEAAQFDDAETGKFFLRTRFTLDPAAEIAFRQRFAAQAATSRMNWSLRSHDERRKGWAPSVISFFFSPFD